MRGWSILNPRRKYFVAKVQNLLVRLRRTLQRCFLKLIKGRHLRDHQPTRLSKDFTLRYARSDPKRWVRLLRRRQNGRCRRRAPRVGISELMRATSAGGNTVIPEVKESSAAQYFMGHKIMPSVGSLSTCVTTSRLNIGRRFNRSCSSGTVGATLPQKLQRTGKVAVRRHRLMA